MVDLQAILAQIIALSQPHNTMIKVLLFIAVYSKVVAQHGQIGRLKKKLAVIYFRRQDGCMLFRTSKVVKIAVLVRQ